MHQAAMEMNDSSKSRSRWRLLSVQGGIPWPSSVREIQALNVLHMLASFGVGRIE